MDKFDYNNRMILLVDDLESMHNSYHEILSPEKDETSTDLDKFDEEFFGTIAKNDNMPVYKLDSAMQGEEAHKKVVCAKENNSPYAMAFVDVRMPPGWNGIETIERIWKTDPDIQVVICTAYSDFSWQEIFERFGKSDQLVLLRKPFDQTEVLQPALAMTEKWNLTQRARMNEYELKQLVRERTLDLEQTNEKLREAIKEIERKKQLEIEARQLKTANDIATTIAHEFNNPLAIMKGAYDLMMMDGIPQHQKSKQAVKIPEQIQKMHDLVQKLLKIQQIKEIDYAAGLKFLDIHNLSKD